MISGRMVIYAQDIENILGRSARGARLLLQRIKMENGKTKQQFVSVVEFCKYTGLEEDLVRECLQGK